MELLLHRTYHPNGTNGRLYYNEVFLCYTIELPWRHNELQRSCISEGRYRLEKRYSARLGHHYWLRDVPGRELILIHPANDALKELKGCIAPVSFLTGEGRGSFSRMAMKLLQEIIEEGKKEEEECYLTIKSAYPSS